ncbi:HEAT repeat domain-containing protein [Terrimonas alba]|uniref:HEAT repeat domain-containing protein n=1 Tax=Terrimonas alba TaxID=3349636 RepID=UPI0035F2225A
MKKPMVVSTSKYHFISLCVLAITCVTGCKQEAADKKIKQMDPAKAAKVAATVESIVKPELADSNLTMSLWGIDSLVISPIAIDIDDNGDLYYVTTNRQKNSEFDIRSHQEWEIPSIQLQTIDDKRAFLRKVLSPENSKNNLWLKDVNGDSSHDWRDMTVEKENIYRIQDTDGDGVADKSQLVVDDFHDEVTDVAGGLLIDGKDLYVSVGPDMWRMKDKNGDGIADDKTSMSHGYGIHIGFSGHGMSGVEMGPDGRIYWQIGDIGFNGTDQTGKKWEYPNCGVIARSNPDGSDFEIFASGLRNTHEFVFDEYANLISEDNDGDHAGEKERLVYIVNGSDAGWRSNWQYGKYRDPENNTYKVWMDEKMWMPRFEGQAAYITPCISNYVSGPSGMVYNPGTALSPEYKNTFFIGEFVGNPAQSGVYGFKLKPKGASFELGDSKKIVGGVLPTGLDFGPDGALYIADWIDGWGTHDYGRVWKLDDKRGTAERNQTKTLLAADFTAKKENELGDLLKNADMRVRMKAQFELAKRGASGDAIFQKALAQTENQLARVHAIWGISQLARKEKKYAESLLPLLQDKDPEIRAQAAKWLGDTKYKEAGSKLIPLLKDSDSRTRFFAAEALGRTEHEPAINALIELLQTNNDEDAYIRHAASLALAKIGKADPLINLAKNPSRAVRIGAVVALRRMAHPGIANFLNDVDEFVVTEAARAINDDLSIKDALPALGNLLNTTRFTNEALIRRCINANLRVGTDQSLQNLVSYSTREETPAKMRAEAIDALSTWAKPSVVDRVDGRYRGVIQRDLASLKAKTSSTLVSLLQNKDMIVKTSAVKAISKLKINEGNAVLMNLVKNDKEPSVRVEALKALAAIGDAQIGDAIKSAIADKDKSVRIAGIDLLPKMSISKELMVSLLSDVINTKTSEEKQAALLTLGNLPVQNSKAVFDDLLQKMGSGKLSSDVYLELAEAVDSTRSSELITKYKQISSSLSPDTLASAYAGSLYGGDPDKGRRIFFRNQSAQCIRCHSYDDMGGNAGPRLNGVAARLTRPQILEALINPSARLAPGFGFITLELKSGKTVSGTLNGETATSLVVKTGDQQNETIAKDQVAKRTNAASSMPEMKNILSKKEIRDVVSFLAQQKENTYKATTSTGEHGTK